MDYETLILARQEAGEIADECNGDCLHCLAASWCDYCDTMREECDD